MRNLLRFLIRYHLLFIFLLLEIVAFILIAQFSSFQRSRIFRFKHNILGTIERKTENLTQYFDLSHENEELVRENARLYNMLPSAYYNPLATSFIDTSLDKRYSYSEARVINNSTNKQYNFLLIDRGRKQGVEPDMGVICADGIVGVVKETSENFSTVVSVLNREFFPNAMIEHSEQKGPIEWPGSDYRKVVLTEITLDKSVNIGDTIVTSGVMASTNKASIFPRGVLIGTVDDLGVDRGLFHMIHVKLATDYKKLSNVFIVKNLMREEQKEILETLEND